MSSYYGSTAFRQIFTLFKQKLATIRQTINTAIDSGMTEITDAEVEDDMDEIFSEE
jgi:hypothetical protein